MNGSEVETRKSAEPKYAYNKGAEISDQEKLDLVVFAQMPQFKTLCRMMEAIIIKSRNRAMEVDPANRDAQVAALTIAKAQKDFYEELRGDIEFSQAEHISDVRQKIATKDLEDQKKLEEIIFANQTGQ